MRIKNFNPNYFVADGAIMNDEIERFSDFGIAPITLYVGMEEEAIADVGPFLIDIYKNIDAQNWIIDNTDTSISGIFLKTNAEYDDILDHLQSLILVEDEEGNEMYFRFYDPRVLIKFLPTCNASQLKQFFGPVSEFYVFEDGSKGAIKYLLLNGKLMIVNEEVENDIVIENLDEKKVEEQSDSDLDTIL
jgi:hypothetical protein